MPTTRGDLGVGRCRGQLVERADDRDGGRVEPDLLRRLPKGAGDDLLACVEPAAGEGHLVAMGTQVARSHGEDDPGLTVLLVEGYQHGGGSRRLPPNAASRRRRSG